MKISFPIINYYPKQQINNKHTTLKPNTLDCDTVTFTGKKPRTTMQKLESLPEKCFPSTGLKEYLFKEASKPENKDKSIIELHREYYAPLETCATLDEAKTIFPEFSNVVDLKDTDLSKLRPHNILLKISKGEFEGLTLENVSLELLKRYIGRLIPVTRDENKEYFGLKRGTICTLFDRINLRNNKKYTDLITSDRSQEKMTERWHDDTERKRLLTILRTEEQSKKCSEASKKYYSTDEARKKASELSKQRWEDPEYREKMLTVMQSDENRQFHSKKQKENWQDPEYREKMLAIARSEEMTRAKSERQKALWQDPEFREKMLAIAQSDESRELQKERMTALWQDSEFREKMLAAMQTDENRAVCSKKAVERWQDPEYKAKMALVNKARQEAWKHHPDFSEAYSKIAEDFPFFKSSIP